MSDQASRIAQLYSNPVTKFPVPRLPQLEVQCSGDALQVLQDDFTVYDTRTQTGQWKGTLQRLTSQLVKAQQQKADSEAAIASEREELKKEVAQLRKQNQIAVQELNCQLERVQKQKANSETKWRESVRQKETAIAKLIEEKKGLEKDLQKLKKQVVPPQLSEFEHDNIAMLSQSQEEILQEEAHRLQLVFDIDRALKYIQLKGSKESIAEMKVKIVEILEKVASRKQQAEMLMKVVQWKRMDSSETLYDPLTNLEIEEAYCAGKPEYVFSHPRSAERFTIDFTEMDEIDHTLNDQTCRVKRIVEGAEYESWLPDDWEPMTDPTCGKEVPLRVINLPAGSKGYQFALTEFHKTMAAGSNYTAIVTIQRIQNPSLYDQYIAKKKYMDTHNPKGVQNERWLFHGTTSVAVPQINQTNFNRCFRGQNGTAYGQGYYFARDASYSNRCASPDAQGLKHIYVVRVLTGEYTRGHSSMLVAPPKDPKDPTVLFDSVVDNMSTPSIYVTFYDADAYPEYLIVYK